MSDPELFGWATDVPISMPLQPQNPPAVGLGAGFAMTQGGIAPDITEAISKRLATPTFQPRQQAQVIWEDADLEQGFLEDEDPDMRTF